MRNKVYLDWSAVENGGGHEAGRALLARMYRQATGKPLPEIRVTDRGKPFFPGSPWHFSISHTPRHVFCALTLCPVGIDCEEMDRPVRPQLAKKVMSTKELLRWERSADKNRAFLRLWVLKEAAAKLTGEGLRGYPNHTDFDPEDSRVREIAGCYVAVLTEEETYAV